MKWAASILLLLGIAYMGYHGFMLSPAREGGGPTPLRDQHSAWVMPALGSLAIMAGIVLWRGRQELD